MRSSRTKGSKGAPVVSGPAEDPILPFSVTISKDEMPRNYSGIPFDPQIFFGAQANGFYGTSSSFRKKSNRSSSSSNLFKFKKTHKKNK